MAWNFRVCKLEDDEAFYITEVFYDNKGKIKGWCDVKHYSLPSTFYSKAECLDDLEYIKMAWEKEILYLDKDGEKIVVDK